MKHIIFSRPTTITYNVDFSLTTVCVCFAECHLPSTPSGFKILVRAKGIGPSTELWQSSILPLNYTRIVYLKRPKALSFMDNGI